MALESLDIFVLNYSPHKQGDNAPNTQGVTESQMEWWERTWKQKDSERLWLTLHLTFLRL